MHESDNVYYVNLDHVDRDVRVVRSNKSDGRVCVMYYVCSTMHE